MDHTDHGISKSVIVLPKSLRPKIIAIAHNHTGHFGISNTQFLINRHFTWPGLANDVRSHIQACATCQLNSKRKPPKAPL